MRLIPSSAQIFDDILLSVSAFAWNLPVSDFEFIEDADNMHLGPGAFELNLQYHE